MLLISYPNLLRKSGMPDVSVRLGGVAPDTHAKARVHAHTLTLPLGAGVLPGLAGPYDIGKHYQHEADRGVAHLSTMGRAVGGPANFAAQSPSAIFALCARKTGRSSVRSIPTAGAVPIMVALCMNTSYNDMMSGLTMGTPARPSLVAPR